VLRDGKPDFNLLAQREQAQRPLRIQTLSRQIPATYVVFDRLIGFVPEGKDDFGSLIIASEIEGKLTCVGRVGSGFDGELRKKLNARLWSSLRQTPVVATKEKGLWVEPTIYCFVKCMERTSDGKLRAPVFGGIHGE
jgi:ATP-dependent DNA ligase